MLKKVKIQLDEKNHKYIILDEWEGMVLKREATTIISGSSFFKPYIDDSKFSADSKLYGIVAMNLGTSIHKIMEELIGYYKLHRKLDILNKITSKYATDNVMLSNILFNTIDVLKDYEGEIKDIDLEITSGLWDENKDLLFCGTADLILHTSNGKLLIDYKTMLSSDNSTYSFVEIFNNTLDDLINKGISYDYYLQENDIGYNDFLKLQKKALNYIYQFGLYALLNDVDKICMITSLRKEVGNISKPDTIKLVNLVTNKIKNEYY